MKAAAAAVGGNVVLAFESDESAPCLSVAAAAASGLHDAWCVLVGLAQSVLPHWGDDGCEDDLLVSGRSGLPLAEEAAAEEEPLQGAGSSSETLVHGPVIGVARGPKPEY